MAGLEQHDWEGLNYRNLPRQVGNALELDEEPSRTNDKE